jgi:hypothetical protein
MPWTLPSECAAYATVASSSFNWLRTRCATHERTGTLDRAAYGAPLLAPMIVQSYRMLLRSPGAAPLPFEWFGWIVARVNTSCPTPRFMELVFQLINTVVDEVRLHSAAARTARHSRSLCFLHCVGPSGSDVKLPE